MSSVILLPWPRECCLRNAGAYVYTPGCVELRVKRMKMFFLSDGLLLLS
jgi:hypothetical protein